MAQRLLVAVLSAQLLAGCAGAQSAADDRAVADSAIRAGNCSAALSPLDRVISADPADLNARRSRASCYLQLHQLTRAIADYKFVAESNATAEASFDLARAEWAAGQTDNARSALKQASAAASDESTLLQVAETQSAYSDPVAARDTLTKVGVKLRDFRWFVTLGKIDSAQVDPAAFQHDFATALSLAPATSKGGILTTLADAYWSRSQYAEALASYKKALQSPEPLDVVHLYAQVADCQFHLGQLVDAVESYRTGLKSGPDEDFREGLSLGLARTLIRLHRNSEALATLRNLISDKRVSSDTLQQAQSLQQVINSTP